MADTKMFEEFQQLLVHKSWMVSVVWDYFSLNTNKNGAFMVKEEQKPIYWTCHRSVLPKGGNTSNLMAHLKEHLSELHIKAILLQKSSKGGISSMKKTVKVPKPKQPAVINVVKMSKKYSSNSP